MFKTNNTKEYLIIVPKYQKKWFLKNYNTVKLEINESELIHYPMFENNLFGKNDRFLNWNIDLNGLIDDFCENYILHPEKTGFIKDCLLCVFEDCKDFEFFEMAHNLQLIIKYIEIVISNYEKEIQF